jgi:hypothetical protein
MESIVERKQTVGSLLAKANKYRNYAQSVGDWETAERILVLTEARIASAAIHSVP